MPLKEAHESAAPEERIRALRAAVKKIFRDYALAQPVASDWVNQKERIDQWATEFYRRGISPQEVLLAYSRREPKGYLMSVDDLLMIAMNPFTERELVESLNKAMAAASDTRMCQKLTPQEYWAFQQIGISKLRFMRSHEELMRGWKALLRQASLLPDLPPPPSAADPSRSLPHHRSDLTKNKAREVIGFIQQGLLRGFPNEQRHTAFEHWRR